MGGGRGFPPSQWSRRPASDGAGNGGHMPKFLSNPHSWYHSHTKTSTVAEIMQWWLHHWQSRARDDSRYSRHVHHYLFDKYHGTESQGRHHGHILIIMCHYFTHRSANNNCSSYPLTLELMHPDIPQYLQWYWVLGDLQEGIFLNSWYLESVTPYDS